MQNYELILSQLADEQQTQIYAYGFVNWGEKQADKYMIRLIDRFREIQVNPFQYPIADQINPTYRKSVLEKHVIYFSILEDTVEIKAIIGQQDISRLI